MMALATIPLLIPGSEAHRRQRYVSASTCAALFGAHPFLDLPTLAAIKRGDLDDTAGEAAETGNVLEDVVAQWWADREGVTVTKPDVSFVAGPLSASPDRLIVGCSDTLLEVKTTSHQEGVVSPSWWWQVQCQMACTGAERVVIAVLWGGSLVLRDYTIGRDWRAIADLKEAAENFLAALDMGIDPEPVALDPRTETVLVGEQEADWLRDLAKYRQEERTAAGQAKRLKGLIDAAVGGPGMPAGSKAVLVDGEGKQIGELTRCDGRMGTVSSGVRGEPYSIVKADPK